MLPASVEDAVKDAEHNFLWTDKSKDELINAYLNGPRTLSNSRLSYLIVSQSPTASQSSISTPPATPAISRSQTPPFHDDLLSNDKSCVAALDPTSLDSGADYDILICAAHFIGDGMALHNFANEFFTLLAGSAAVPERLEHWRSEEELRVMLCEEWASRWRSSAEEDFRLPEPLEEGLHVTSTRFGKAAARVDFKNSQDQLIGGHSFPRARVKKPRHTVVPTVSFPESKTKQMLKKCKANGVTIANALFALCNIAWSRTIQDEKKKELPMMMYSALNLRPYLQRQPQSHPSVWFLAVGYFNVVLPTFLPPDSAKIFWHRARIAKEQGTRYVKNPMIISRSLEMARERGCRARQWAREDDDAEEQKSQDVCIVKQPTPAPAIPVTQSKPKLPSSALIGLSLLGNLDGIYKHASFPSLQLHTLTTGSRQRPGGMLLFGYTFAGKLWLSLGWDINGFDAAVVDRFWQMVLLGVDEFLL